MGLISKLRFTHNGFYIAKRSLLVGVFCLLSACSKPSTEPHETSSQAQAASEVQPLLSLNELLSADDVKLALAQASLAQDQEALVMWQSRLIDAGEQVNLKSSEMNLLKGEQGLVFLSFQGMKTNYQNDFEKAFFEFGDVDQVYARYPAFESLHQQSKELVEKRDALIDTAARSLQDEGLTQEQAMQQARSQWQKMMAASR
ncbi:hypothetical protein ACFO4O_05080 [Glaciecola siphonariae]|uniref:Lipoprotein n=1 Tax=Glaciecola siphonariae TaxID=521012 RepID=A0ABV9LVR1_9ALTE